MGHALQFYLYSEYMATELFRGNFITSVTVGGIRFLLRIVVISISLFSFLPLGIEIMSWLGLDLVVDHNGGSIFHSVTSISSTSSTAVATTQFVTSLSAPQRVHENWSVDDNKHISSSSSCSSSVGEVEGD